MFDGPRNLDSVLELMADLYAFTFLFWLKRRVVFNDSEESDNEDDDSKT